MPRKDLVPLYGPMINKGGAFFLSKQSEVRPWVSVATEER